MRVVTHTVSKSVMDVKHVRPSIGKDGNMVNEMVKIRPGYLQGQIFRLTILLMLNIFQQVRRHVFHA